MKTVSVALTTYNGEKYLEMQLESIRRQTYMPAELVVTDDSSSDRTFPLLERFAKGAGFPVHLHRNAANLGWRRNFINTLCKCRSDLVALCDQDDIWHPDKLAAAAAALSDPDTVLFVHNAWLIDGSGKRTGAYDKCRTPHRVPPLASHSFYSPSGMAMVCARELLQFSDLWEFSSDSILRDEFAPHDQWLFFLASVFGAVVYSSARLTEYRQHEKNTYGYSGGLSGSGGVIPALKAIMHGRARRRSDYEALAISARNRANILSASQDRLQGPWLQRAIVGERNCRRLARYTARRAELYGTTSLRSKIDILLTLYRDGAYSDLSGWSIGIGRASLMKDLALAVLGRGDPAGRSESC